MDSNFYEMIFRRKSFHFFRNVGNESISKDELNDIQSAYSDFIPLNPGIKTAIRIVPEKQTNCRRGGEYCVLLYSEKRDDDRHMEMHRHGINSGCRQMSIFEIIIANDQTSNTTNI